MCYYFLKCFIKAAYFDTKSFHRNIVYCDLILLYSFSYENLFDVSIGCSHYFRDQLASVHILSKIGKYKFGKRQTNVYFKIVKTINEHYFLKYTKR